MQYCGALARGLLLLMSPGPGPVGQDLLLYFPSAGHTPKRSRLGWRPHGKQEPAGLSFGGRGT